MLVIGTDVSTPHSRYVLPEIAPNLANPRTRRRSSEERNLIERAKKRDHSAYVQLYESYVSKIYRYVYIKVGNAADAEDITAQVFVNAWEAIGRYKITQIPFIAWLYRIAHNLVIDFYRTVRYDESIDEMPALEEPSPDLAGLVQRQFTAAVLSDALRRITLAQQQVLLLRFVEGYSTIEVARIMQRNPGAVRTLQHRALVALDALLRDDARLPDTPARGKGRVRRARL